MRRLEHCVTFKARRSGRYTTAVLGTFLSIHTVSSGTTCRSTTTTSTASQSSSSSFPHLVSSATKSYASASGGASHQSVASPIFLQHAAALAQRARAKRHSSLGPTSSLAKTTTDSPYSSSPPLLLDDPFTPIDGEAAILHRRCGASSASTSLSSSRAMQQQQQQQQDSGTRRNSDPNITRGGNEDGVDTFNEVVEYVCRRCEMPLFVSTDFVDGSRVGLHRSGWPSFAVSLPHAVTLRSVRQKTTVGGRSALHNHCGSIHTRQGSGGGGGHDASSSSHVSMRSAGMFSGAHLSDLVPERTLAPRGLAVERDYIRLGGQSIQKVKTKTWRETCLRDENKRSDWSFLEGCCAGCGAAACRVITSKARGDSKLVATSSTVIARVRSPVPSSG